MVALELKFERMINCESDALPTFPAWDLEFSGLWCVFLLMLMLNVVILLWDFKICFHHIVLLYV